MNGIVLLVAAGEGSRLGCGPKAFVELAGMTLLRRSAAAARAAELVEGLVVAVPPGLEDRATGELERIDGVLGIVAGGESRQESVGRALEAAGDPAAVAVHDAARPLCPPELFDRCLAALDDAEAVVAAVRVTDTVKEVTGDLVEATLDRSRLVAAQTPQAFRTDVLRKAHLAAVRDGVEATDDVALVERLGIQVRVVPGDERNLKITTRTDLALAEVFLGAGGGP